MAAALATLAGLAACADLSRPPLFPPGAAEQPVVQEQALIGLSPGGDAAAAQLLLAEGEPPRLALLALDAQDGSPRVLAAAPPGTARAVAARLVAQGEALEPLLGSAVAALWPEANAVAAELGFAPAEPAFRGPSGRLPLPSRAAGWVPLSLRIGARGGSPPAQALLLAEAPGGVEGGDEVELAAMPVSGRAVAPLLFNAGGAAWMLAGSVQGSADGKGGPLRRTVGLRRASLARGEAELHRRRARKDLDRGARASGRRALERAVEADPLFADALYDAAAAAARDAEVGAALALLQRAARSDPRRVQVRGRSDPDLGSLRLLPEVRALLGLTPTAPAEGER